MVVQASADGQQMSERLADPLAHWFQQHFLALDAAGMLGLPFACSAESGILPQVKELPLPATFPRHFTGRPA